VEAVFRRTSPNWKNSGEGGGRGQFSCVYSDLIRRIVDDSVSVAMVTCRDITVKKGKKAKAL